MWKVLWLLLFGVMTTSSVGATKVSVEQLEQTLAADKGKPDAEVARHVAQLELTEELSSSRLQQLEAEFPGAATRGVLLMLADSAAFLAPPAAEVVSDPMPDGPSLRQMLNQVVTYVNKTVRQLPNFTATRTTTGFEDSPAVDVLGQLGVTSYSYVPLHTVGTTSVRVLYRDRREELDDSDKKGGKHETPIGGLKTAGEFGPILSTVLADAVAGKITWGRWERGPGGTRAVFRYVVSKEKSHYVVQFCCVTEGVDPNTGLPERRIYSETAAYHGEITFDPATGTILRMTAQAEQVPGDLVSEAGMLVEYGPVEIGGRTVVCATKSVSLLRAHTTPQEPGAKTAASYKGEPKTFLNDVAFGQYHEFRAQAKILTGVGDGASGLSVPGTADSPGATPARTTPH